MDKALKEWMASCGIKTISTDFKQMGEKLEQMIVNHEYQKIENSNSLILRNSL